MRTPNMIKRIVKNVKKRFLKLKKAKHTKVKSLIPVSNWRGYHGGNDHRSKTFKMNQRKGC